MANKNCAISPWHWATCNYETCDMGLKRDLTFTLSYIVNLTIS